MSHDTLDSHVGTSTPAATHTTSSYTVWRTHGLVAGPEQTTVTHFGENKRLHLESCKQNYYIISLWVIIKAIFMHTDSLVLEMIQIQKLSNHNETIC